MCGVGGGEAGVVLCKTNTVVVQKPVLNYISAWKLCLFNITIWTVRLCILSGDEAAGTAQTFLIF